jgi:hypothetical protein
MAQFFQGPTSFQVTDLPSNSSQFANILGGLVSVQNNKLDNRGALLRQVINSAGNIEAQALQNRNNPNSPEQGQRDAAFFSEAYNAINPDGTVDYTKFQDAATKHGASRYAVSLAAQQMGPRTTFLSQRDKYNITQNVSDRDPRNPDIEQDWNAAYQNVRPGGNMPVAQPPIIQERPQPQAPQQPALKPSPYQEQEMPQPEVLYKPKPGESQASWPYQQGQAPQAPQINTEAQANAIFSGQAPQAPQPTGLQGGLTASATPGFQPIRNVRGQTDLANTQQEMQKRAQDIKEKQYTLDVIDNASNRLDKTGNLVFDGRVSNYKASDRDRQLIQQGHEELILNKSEYVKNKQSIAVTASALQQYMTAGDRIEQTLNRYGNLNAIPAIGQIINDITKGVFNRNKAFQVIQGMTNLPPEVATQLIADAESMAANKIRFARLAQGSAQGISDRDTAMFGFLTNPEQYADPRSYQTFKHTANEHLYNMMYDPSVRYGDQTGYELAVRAKMNLDSAAKNLSRTAIPAFQQPRTIVPQSTIPQSNSNLNNLSGKYDNALQFLRNRGAL